MLEGGDYSTRPSLCRGAFADAPGAAEVERRVTANGKVYHLSCLVVSLNTGTPI